MKIGLTLAGWKKIPYDSAIHIKGNNIKKIFVSIDVNPSDIYLAKTLGCDCILTHHPIGKTLIQFHKVFDRHVDYMINKGIKKKLAMALVKTLKDRVYLKSHSVLYDDIISTCKLLKMPILNIHQPLDEYMRQVILAKIKNDNPHHVSDLVESVQGISEFKNSLSRILVCNGRPSNKLGNWVLVLAAGSNGGYEIARTYYEHGVSTVIYLHVDYNELVKLRKENTEWNLVILGHLAGDSIGMNAICQELTSREIQVIKRGIIDN